MKRTITIILGFIGLLVGLGFIMPALAQWRTQGSLPGASVALLLLGILLSLGGLLATANGCRKPKA
jgi:hypothetical protein